MSSGVRWFPVLEIEKDLIFIWLLGGNIQNNKDENMKTQLKRNVHYGLSW